MYIRRRHSRLSGFLARLRSGFPCWLAPVLILLVTGGCRHRAPAETAYEPRTIDGYRGIWFTLGQVSEYGDKYSGGLGTYTAKHHPLAVYAPEVDKTFFVYGGTTEAGARHLLAMISYYDHAAGTVPRPVVVHDKQIVDDPHDNPSINIDASGHIWVFVSGRGSIRPGFIYRSARPYDIDEFELVMEDEFAYPQPWATPDGKWVFLFTRYTDGRELYWRTYADSSWSPPQKLVSGGHYQMSHLQNGRLITAFNTHFPNRNVDTRSNLSFLSTWDGGQSWQTAGGVTAAPPLDSLDTTALVRDYRKEGLLVYLKDIGFDAKEDPVLLYITSRDYKPGPSGSPRTWTLARWKQDRWLFNEVAPAYHNYDMGSIYFEDDGTWRIIAPTEPGPQTWGSGGEVAMWTSGDEGANWTKVKTLTSNSVRNHGYVRRPLYAHPDFYAFWADGNPDSTSISRLYFTSKDGEVRVLPYEMNAPFERPAPASF